MPDVPKGYALRVTWLAKPRNFTKIAMRQRLLSLLFVLLLPLQLPPEFFKLAINLTHKFIKLQLRFKLHIIKTSLHDSKARVGLG